MGMQTAAIGRTIGAASVALGLIDLAMGRRFGAAVGAGAELGGRLFRIAGAREVMTGLAGLRAPDSAAPVRWRLAGDIFDLALLAYIAAPANPRRRTALFACGLVAGVTLVDWFAARALDGPGREDRLE